jgi:hypothetical protein
VLLLPLLLFLLWIWARKRARDRGEDLAALDYKIAALMGAAIIGILIIAWLGISDDVGDRDALYVAPYVNEQGEVVPGHFVDPETGKASDQTDDKN